MQQTVTSVEQTSARSNRVSIALSGHKRVNNQDLLVVQKHQYSENQMPEPIQYVLPSSNEEGSQMSQVNTARSQMQGKYEKAEFVSEMETE